MLPSGSKRWLSCGSCGEDKDGRRRLSRSTPAARRYRGPSVRSPGRRARCWRPSSHRGQRAGWLGRPSPFRSPKGTFRGWTVFNVLERPCTRNWQSTRDRREPRDRAAVPVPAGQGSRPCRPSALGVRRARRFCCASSAGTWRPGRVRLLRDFGEPKRWLIVALIFPAVAVSKNASVFHRLQFPGASARAVSASGRARWRSRGACAPSPPAARR